MLRSEPFYSAQPQVSKYMDQSINGCSVLHLEITVQQSVTKLILFCTYAKLYKQACDCHCRGRTIWTRRQNVAAGCLNFAKSHFAVPDSGVACLWQNFNNLPSILPLWQNNPVAAVCKFICKTLHTCEPFNQRPFSSSLGTLVRGTTASATQFQS